MRARLMVVAGLAFLAFPESALARGVLPPASPQVPKSAESEGVSESELPLVRAHLEGSAEVWVGQAVSLDVEVIVPTWFTSAPTFPQLEVENSATLSPEGAVNTVVQAGGKTFAAQTRRYLFCPQTRGRYTVPSISVGVTYGLPDGKSSPAKLLSSPPVPFEARMPPGAEGAKYFLAAESFRIRESVEGKPDELKLGDSLARTVTMTAEHTVGMSLPPLEFQAPEGVRLYPGIPKITETAERGTIEATRTETATFVPEKEGLYRLPEITILWWDPQTEQMNKAELPSIELEVQAVSGHDRELFASSATDETSSGVAEDKLRKHLSTALQWGAPLLAMTLILLVIRHLLALKGLSLALYLAERRRQRAEAESAHFRQFRRASRTHDPRAALRRLMLWLDRATAGPSTPTLRRFVTESGVPELAERAGELTDLLFARQTNAEQVEAQREWSGKGLYKLVAKARRLQKKRSKHQHRKPPLIHDMN
ncbi:MAG: BatD family protein [Planctomycetota bacterium]